MLVSFPGDPPVYPATVYDHLLIILHILKVMPVAPYLINSENPHASTFGSILGQLLMFFVILTFRNFGVLIENVP